MKCSNLFKNMKLKTQLYLTYVVLIIISMSIMSIAYYKTSCDITIKNVENTSLNLVKNNNNLINIKLNKILESSDAITLDHQLYNIMNDYKIKTDYDYLYEDKLINNILFKYFNFSDVYSAHIITPEYNFGSSKIPIKRGYYNDSLLYDIAEKSSGSLSWVPTYKFADVYDFKEFEDINLDYKYLFSAVKIMNNLDSENLNFSSNNKEKPLLIVNFKPDIFDEIVNKESEYQDSKYYIVSKEKGIVYSSNQSDIGRNKEFKWLDNISNESGVLRENHDGSEWIVCYDTLDSTGWISVMEIPVNDILNDFIKMRKFILFLGIILIITSCICAGFIAKTITKPIKNLLQAIKEMGKGNFSNKVEIKGNYEIVNLITKFNEMDEKISNLIEQNYMSSIREKEATIMSLNIQLNPHFLYNTLNTINWIAIENDENEISRMIVALSNMLQYTAHNKEECCKFEEDLNWLKKYIYIMQSRFEDKFKVEYSIDERLNLYRVPKLFLQPFVENSIIHGFSLIDEGGILKIEGIIEEDRVVFIVSDNGKGIEEDKIKDILEKNKDRIGISNVNNRIKLMYGEEYGVKINSKLNIETKVIISLPLISKI